MYLRPDEEHRFRILRQDVTIRKYIGFNPAHKLRRGYYTTGMSKKDYSEILARDAPDLADYPAVVTWFEAYSYAAWIGARLPSLLEWRETCEQALPGAPLSRDAGYFSIQGRPVAEFAWSDANSQNGIHPVGRLRADLLGIHDLLGNVTQWADEWLESNRDIAPDGKPVTVLLTGEAGSRYTSPARELGCNYAYSEPSDSYSVGFRLAMSAAER